MLEMTKYVKDTLESNIKSLLNIKMFMKTPLIIVQETQCSTQLYV